MSDVQINRDVYNKVSEHLIQEYLKNPENTEITDLYRGLTGDNDLSTLKNKLVYKEIEEFIEQIQNNIDNKSRKEGDPILTIDDHGYDYDAFYLRFYTNDFSILEKHQKSINEFLQNVADRTGVKISPEFIFYQQLQPSEKKEETVVQAPKISYNKLMEVELN